MGYRLFAISFVSGGDDITRAAIPAHEVRYQVLTYRFRTERLASSLQPVCPGVSVRSNSLVQLDLQRFVSL